jgi:hypothetical protein
MDGGFCLPECDNGLAFQPELHRFERLNQEVLLIRKLAKKIAQPEKIAPIHLRLISVRFNLCIQLGASPAKTSKFSFKWPVEVLHVSAQHSSLLSPPARAYRA